MDPASDTACSLAFKLLTAAHGASLGAAIASCKTLLAHAPLPTPGGVTCPVTSSWPPPAVWPPGAHLVIDCAPILEISAGNGLGDLLFVPAGSWLLTAGSGTAGR